MHCVKNWFHAKQNALGENKMLSFSNKHYKRHLQRPLRWKRSAWISWKTLNTTINVDWHEGTISKRCWNACENNQTKFEPHASCIYFGSISSYASGGKNCKITSKTPWRWEVPITRFDIMVKDIWNVSLIIYPKCKRMKA